MKADGTKPAVSGWGVRGSGPAEATARGPRSPSVPQPPARASTLDLCDG